MLKWLQVLVLGQPGEEVNLELILRVVADIGVVVCMCYFSFGVANCPFLVENASSCLVLGAW